VLVDALGVDDEQVKPTARLRQDLGAESIDFLDIVFRLEKAFSIKIPRGEMIPEGVMTDPNFVQNGRVTPAGMIELKKRMPYVDLTEFEKDPQVDQLPFTVDAVVNYVQTKVS
jgi:acyl carrier protein